MRAVLVSAVAGSALAVTAALAGCGVGAPPRGTAASAMAAAPSTVPTALPNSTGVVAAIAFDGDGEQSS